MKTGLFVLLLSFCFVNSVRCEKIGFTELCVDTGVSGYPQWVELQNRNSDKVNLKGYQLKSGSKTVHRFDKDYALKKGEYLLFCFYPGSKISKEFEESLPNNTKHINLLNNGILCEKEEIPESHGLKKSDIDFLKDPDYYDIDEKTKTKQHSVTISSKRLKNESEGLFNKYDQMVKEYCRKNKMPLKYRDVLIIKLFRRPLYMGELQLYSPNDKLVSSLSWGNEKSKISFTRETYMIGKDIYLGSVIDDYGRERKVYSFYDASPGTGQSIKAFKNLTLKTANNCFKKEDERILRLDFYSFYHPVKPWSYEFQISADKSFKKVIFSRKEELKLFAKLNLLTIKMSTKEYENLLWNSELYYRIRRILSDGYKTEWVGGECLEMLHKDYKRNQKYKKGVGINNMIHKSMAFEAARRKLEKESENLRISLGKEQNEKRIKALKKEREEKLKQIEDLKLKIEEQDNRVRIQKELSK